MSMEPELTASPHIHLADVEQDNIAYPRVNQRQLAWQDIKDGIKKWRIWYLLAYQDIKLRYRRSVLGPFWITISMAITVYSMGFLYGHLFHIGLKQYYPFLVAGMLAWALISTVITDLTDTFMISEGLIKQIKLPYSLYLHRVIARNLLIFSHNLLVMVPIYFIYHESVQLNTSTLFVIPGLAIIYLNACFFGIILAMIGSRYRDVSQIIKSLIQVVFFVTPVMWSPEILPEPKRFIVFANPFYSYLELVRAPLLGNIPTLFNYLVTFAITFIGMIIAWRMFVNYRSRIIYWL